MPDGSGKVGPAHDMLDCESTAVWSPTSARWPMSIASADSRTQHSSQQALISLRYSKTASLSLPEDSVCIRLDPIPESVRRVVHLPKQISHSSETLEVISNGGEYL